MALTGPQQKGVARWIIFSVMLGALPIGLALLGDLLINTESHPIANGDLFLISAVLCFAAVGELLGISDEAALAKIIIGGISAVLGFAAALLYALVSPADDPNGVLVGWCSLVVWLSSATTGTICVIYARR